MSYADLQKIRPSQPRDLKLGGVIVYIEFRKLGDFESVHKTCQRQLTELKLGKLIVHAKFHKICKFENHVTRNDVIMMSLPKTIENNGKCGPLQSQTNYI